MKFHEPTPLGLRIVQYAANREICCNDAANAAAILFWCLLPISPLFLGKLGIAPKNSSNFMQLFSADATIFLKKI